MCVTFQSFDAFHDKILFNITLQFSVEIINSLLVVTKIMF
jgi:hypothetical protein